MSTTTGVNVSWTALAGGALLCLAVGAGAVYLGGPRGGAASGATGDGVSAPAGATPATPSGAPVAATAAGHAHDAGMADRSAPLPDVAISLGSEAAARGGVTVETVGTVAAADSLRAPGVVEANAYRQVAVTPLLSGRLTRVAVELGQSVKKGDTLAELFSPELSEAQTRYITVRAELAAHELELNRTERLVKLGAASQQELERLHAEHTARLADLASAAARLQLLGLTPRAIEALSPGTTQGVTSAVVAPQAGVITERLGNVGLNVDPATRLFTVTDLSTVWVVAEVYEQDFSRVHVGSVATVTTRAYPDLALSGRVSYIDPQLSAETRTAKLRVEVPNARQALRLGMYAEVALGMDASRPVPGIPRSAVQHVGDRTVVYLVDPAGPGRYIEREVRLGAIAGNQVAVLAGVATGDRVVGEGSFYVRAERERLGLRASVPSSAEGSATASAPVPAPAGSREPAVQTATVNVGAQEFTPATVRLRAGVPARITFIRTEETSCGTDVVFPSLNIRKPLPLKVPVVVEFTPAKAGELSFTCGAGMFKGVVVVS